MKTKVVSLLLGGLAFSLLGMSFARQSLAETWYGYCWVEKNNSHVCKPPEVRDDDFNIKCRDFSNQIRGERWGARYSTSVASLEATMGQHCDEIWEQQGQIFTCNLEALCPEASSEISVFYALGNRVYSADKGLAIERCSELNQHRVLAAVNRYSKADCSIKLVPQILE